ncbi:hypothetical protein FRB99_003267 [Tulasnella sp. 403]|nr:hypothetical protein FRB99_003267 [Tulasnella sp. 403]
MVENYSCRCLNVKLQGVSSSDPLSDGYRRLQSTDDGVQVSLPHFTIRSRAYVGEGENRTRYTTVTCILCATVSYRVRIEEDVVGEGPEGPLLPPSGEWREEQPLKSKDNWIEISKECWSGLEYTSAFSSPSFSPTFTLLLPPRDIPSSATAPTPDPLIFKIPSLAASLPPLFLAPPFTPSHPVFQAFSRHAIRASDELRKDLEAELETFLQGKLKELGEAEEKLKGDVDCLWKHWRDTWQDLTKKETPKPKKRSSVVVPQVHDFTPRPMAPSPRNRPHSPTADVASPSLLSASLAQPSLHQHMGGSPKDGSPDPHAPVSGSPTLDDLAAKIPVQQSIMSGPYKRLQDDSFAVAASYKLAMEDQAGFAAKMEAIRLRQQEKLQRANEEQEQDGSASHERGRSGANGRRVQFAEEPKDAEASKDEQEEQAEPEVFDFDPPTEFAQPKEASLTPVASPRRREVPLPEAQNNLKDKETQEQAPSAAEQQFMDVVGAGLPSHRNAWKSSAAWNIFNDSSNTATHSPGSAIADDDDSVSDLSESNWKNPSVEAQSLPVTIAPISQLRPFGTASRQPKSSLADKPGGFVPPLVRRRSSAAGQRTSTSVATRERVYAERDISRSMDPGLSMPANIEDEEDEEDVAATEATEAGLHGEATTPDTPVGRSRKRALLILKKSRENNAPDAAMWRSLAD